MRAEKTVVTFKLACTAAACQQVISQLRQQSALNRNQSIDISQQSTDISEQSDSTDGRYVVIGYLVGRAHVSRRVHTRNGVDTTTIETKHVYCLGLRAGLGIGQAMVFSVREQ